MANIVSQILTQGKAVATTVLGSTYQDLRHVFDLELNAERNLRLGFGFRALSGVPSANSIVQHYTMDHDFELVLTDTIPRGSDDQQIETIIDTAMSKVDDWFKGVVATKLNLPSNVLLISSPTVLEPEFLGSKAVVVRAIVTVTYRTALVTQVGTFPTIAYSGTTWTEAGANDGTISAALVATVSSGKYRFPSGALTEDVHYKLDGTAIPSGLTLVVTVTSSLTADLTLTGSADSHTSSDGVTGIILTWLGAAFEGENRPNDGTEVQAFAITFTD